MKRSIIIREKLKTNKVIENSEREIMFSTNLWYPGPIYNRLIVFIEIIFRPHLVDNGNKSTKDYTILLNLYYG